MSPSALGRDEGMVPCTRVSWTEGGPAKAPCASQLALRLAGSAIRAFSQRAGLEGSDFANELEQGSNA